MLVGVDDQFQQYAALAHTKDPGGFLSQGNRQAQWFPFEDGHRLDSWKIDCSNST